MKAENLWHFGMKRNSFGKILWNDIKQHMASQMIPILSALCYELSETWNKCFFSLTLQ